MAISATLKKIFPHYRYYPFLVPLLFDMFVYHPYKFIEWIIKTVKGKLNRSVVAPLPTKLPTSDEREEEKREVKIQLSEEKNFLLQSPSSQAERDTYVKLAYEYLPYLNEQSDEVQKILFDVLSAADVKTIISFLKHVGTLCVTADDGFWIEWAGRNIPNLFDKLFTRQDLQAQYDDYIEILMLYKFPLSSYCLVNSETDLIKQQACIERCTMIRKAVYEAAMNSENAAKFVFVSTTLYAILSPTADSGANIEVAKKPYIEKICAKYSEQFVDLNTEGQLNIPPVELSQIYPGLTTPPTGMNREIAKEMLSQRKKAEMIKKLCQDPSEGSEDQRAEYCKAAYFFLHDSKDNDDMDYINAKYLIASLPNHPTSFFYNEEGTALKYANFLIEQGRGEEAVAYLERILQIHPPTADHNLLSADQWVFLGSYISTASEEEKTATQSKKEKNNKVVKCFINAANKKDEQAITLLGSCLMLMHEQKILLDETNIALIFPELGQGSNDICAKLIRWSVEKDNLSLLVETLITILAEKYKTSDELSTLLEFHWRKGTPTNFLLSLKPLVEELARRPDDKSDLLKQLSTKFTSTHEMPWITALSRWVKEERSFSSSSGHELLTGLDVEDDQGSKPRCS